MSTEGNSVAVSYTWPEEVLQRSYALENETYTSVCILCSSARSMKDTPEVMARKCDVFYDPDMGEFYPCTACRVTDRGPDCVMVSRKSHAAFVYADQGSKLHKHFLPLLLHVMRLKKEGADGFEAASLDFRKEVYDDVPILRREHVRLVDENIIMRALITEGYCA